MPKNDIKNKADIERIIAHFYEQMLKDPIIGFIFTDVVKIHLESHLPVISNFWADIILKDKSYNGNAMQVHLDLHQKMPLRAGHFTRWLYLFSKSVDDLYQGENAKLMKQRAEQIAKSISGRIAGQHKGDMDLVLP